MKSLFILKRSVVGVAGTLVGVLLHTCPVAQSSMTLESIQSSDEAITTTIEESLDVNEERSTRARTASQACEEVVYLRGVVDAEEPRDRPDARARDLRTVRRA